MGLFDKFKKKEKTKPSFYDIDSMEKVIELANKNILKPLYLMPLRFNGEESERNRIFVPEIVVELKNRYDDMVEELLVQGKVNGYSCSPEYKGKSFVAARLTVVAKQDGKEIFTETIEIW